jgi:cyclopropane-fatty-acyl-phospholipid synthase
LLELTGRERVLEIGCGWGALAERLTRAHGCRVTGLTLSTEQLAYAQERLAGEIAAGNADLRLQDYRDCSGRFDRVVSIEMLEAVGERYWPAYFDRLRACLRDGGLAVLQVITIADARFEAYRRRPDFIQRHVFPGGMLPPSSAIVREAERAGLAVRAAEHFGLDYARTLAEWRRRFLQSWPAIRELSGFDARFRRLWDYYLAYCQVGFEAGHVDVALYQIAHRPA